MVIGSACTKKAYSAGVKSLNGPSPETQRAESQSWFDQYRTDGAQDGRICKWVVNPLDVAFRLRHFLHPLTATATVAALFAIPCVYHPLRTDFDRHSYAFHLALYSLDHTARVGPDHPLGLFGLDPHNFRVDAAAGGRHLSRTDVRRECQLARRLTPFQVSQYVSQRFEDSLGML